MQCHLHVYKYSTSKGHSRVKDQGSIFWRESRRKSHHSTLSHKLGPRHEHWPGQTPLPTTSHCTGGGSQGTSLPLLEPHARLLPGLLTFCSQRQGEWARAGRIRPCTPFLSRTSQASRTLTCAGCVHTGGGQGGRRKGEGRFWGSEFSRMCNTDSGFIYFLFSLIAINWLLISGNVQLSRLLKYNKIVSLKCIHA